MLRTSSLLSKRCKSDNYKGSNSEKSNIPIALLEKLIKLFSATKNILHFGNINIIFTDCNTSVKDI